MAKDKTVGKGQLIDVRITHLELLHPQPKNVPTPLNASMALMRTKDMPLHFYRYLYRLVGKPHHWQARRTLDDAALSAIIHNENTILHVLYVDGCPAGFSEISVQNSVTQSDPEYSEIVYFGLVPDYQGRGFAKFFLRETIANAWETGAQKVIIQTNTLDNPKALQLYQQFGFEPVGYSTEQIHAWNDNDA